MNLRSAALITALACSLLSAATVRLYMKDGSYHSVREYQKMGDRVRFYSTERGDWEEIPLELVDLRKTEEENASRDAERKKEASLMDAEEKAERSAKREIEAIPYEPGVFQVANEKATALKNAETKVVTNRRRSILKALSPIPVFTGKATVELDGLKAVYTVPAGQPEFFIRLSGEERFEIVRLTSSKLGRIVLNLEIIPVTKEVLEKLLEVETFKQQMADGLFKIWPVKPLAPGEYAVIQYVEGKGNPQVWDFGVVAAPAK